MIDMNEKEARGLLEEKCKDCPNVIEHCESVCRKAVEIAEELKKKGLDVDVELVRVGGLLHDVGRCMTHGIGHAVEGGQILRELKYSEEICRIVERHIGGGIPKEEAVKLGLPEKDYSPETLEEKIVAYADKVHDDYRMERHIEMFKARFGEDSAVFKRLKKLNEEMEKVLGIGS